MFLKFYGSYLACVSGSVARRVTPRNPSNFFISSSVNSKSKISVLALIYSAWTDFGSGRKPCCNDQRSRTWGTLWLWVAATSATIRDPSSGIRARFDVGADGYVIIAC